MNKISRFEFKKLIKEIKDKAQVLECLYLRRNECSEKIIKAHSIQNNKILNKISENGKVLQIKTEEAIYTSDLSYIGRKIATTFTGFCSIHDNLIFKPIEEKDYRIGNNEQEFLFSYRAFAREYITKRTAKNFYKEFMRLYGSQPDLIGMLEWTEFSIKELNKLKNYFYQNLINKKFKIIKTKAIELSKEYTIAVSSIFAPEYDFEGNKINDLSNKKESLKNLFFTIFPQNSKTYILLSYLREENKTFEFLEKQLLQLKEKEIINKLNLILAYYCENFVYSPSKWQAIKNSEKKEFIDLFLESAPRLKDSDELTKESKFNLFF